MSNNKVTLIGNLGKDPEVRQFENNMKASFSVATRDQYRTKTGDWAVDTQWHNVVVWGKLAEKVETELKKGSLVNIEGRLTSRSYNDKEGNKKYITEVVANEVNITSRAA